jgi:hypothetical protein
MVTIWLFAKNAPEAAREAVNMREIFGCAAMRAR